MPRAPRFCLPGWRRIPQTAFPKHVAAPQTKPPSCSRSSVIECSDGGHGKPPEKKKKHEGINSSCPLSEAHPLRCLLPPPILPHRFPTTEPSWDVFMYIYIYTYINIQYIKTHIGNSHCHSQESFSPAIFSKVASPHCKDVSICSPSSPTFISFCVIFFCFAFLFLTYSLLFFFFFCATFSRSCFIWLSPLLRRRSLNHIRSGELSSRSIHNTAAELHSCQFYSLS